MNAEFKMQNAEWILFSKGFFYRLDRASGNKNANLRVDPRFVSASLASQNFFFFLVFDVVEVFRFGETALADVVAVGAQGQ